MNFFRLYSPCDSLDISLRKGITNGIATRVVSTSAVAWEYCIPDNPKIWDDIKSTGRKNRPLRIIDIKVAIPTLPTLWKSMFAQTERGMNSCPINCAVSATAPIAATSGSSLKNCTNGLVNCVPIKATVPRNNSPTKKVKRKAFRTRPYFFAP